jgi:hypothetical protein
MQTHIQASGSRSRLRTRTTVCLVAACCAAAALPFGDASSGFNFIVGPVAAGIVARVLLRRYPRAIASAAAAAVLTFMLMAAAVFVIIAVWGI